MYAGRSPDTNQPVIHAYLNPLVKWIWFGGIVVVLGTGLAMLPNRRAGDCAAAGDGAGVGRERVAGGGRCGDGADSAGGFA